jgi:Flp pilus assembly protein TadD
MRRHLLSRAAIIAILGVGAASCSTMNTMMPKQAAATPAPKPQASAQSTDDVDAMAKLDEGTLADNLDVNIAKAKQQRAAGDVNGAAHTLSQLMLVAPDDPRVVGEYGKVMVSRGRSDDAVAFLKRAVELSPSDWTLYSAIGIAYDQKDDFANAKIAYDRALQLQPTSAAVLNNYAMSRMLAGDLPMAEQLIARANAVGGADPKIAHNVELMASLAKGSSATVYATTPTSAKMPAATASKAPVTVQTASGPVTIQAVPKDTTPKATQAPKALAAKPAPADQTPSLRTAAD